MIAASLILMNADFSSLRGEIKFIVINEVQTSNHRHRLHPSRCNQEVRTNTLVRY